VQHTFEYVRPSVFDAAVGNGDNLGDNTL